MELGEPSIHIIQIVLHVLNYSSMFDVTLVLYFTLVHCIKARAVKMFLIVFIIFTFKKHFNKKLEESALNIFLSAKTKLQHIAIF